MAVVGIDNVEFIVEDAAEAAAYLTRWGWRQAPDDARRLLCADD